MKRMKYVSFNIPKGKKEKAKSILAEIGLDVPKNFENEDSEILSASHSVILEEESEELLLLLEKLKDAKITSKPFMRNERSYTDEELNTAYLFWIKPQRQKDDGYIEFGTKFGGDSICSSCGGGVVQLSDLIIKCSKFRKTHFAATYNFEFIISAELADMVSQTCSGFDLRPVIGYKTKNKSPKCYQLVPHELIPPLVSPTYIMKSSQYCEVCKKNGLYLRSEMHIEHIPKKQSDAYFTQEFFGEMRTRGCPTPELVLSKRFVEIIRKFDKKAVYVEPVFFKDKVFTWD